MERIKLIDEYDLQRSLPTDSGVFDLNLASWVVEIVSAAAIDLTGRSWREPLDVPPGAMAVLALAARRLYTNPDRFTREAEGDYSYGLDATVTKADVFTPNEVATLKKFSSQKKIRGFGTVGTYRGDFPTRSTVYVPDGTRYGFPWYEEQT